MTENKLIKKALKTPAFRGLNSDLNEDQVELAVAYARGELRLKQVTEGASLNNSPSTYVFLTKALVKYIKDNNL